MHQKVFERSLESLASNETGMFKTRNLMLTGLCAIATKPNTPSTKEKGTIKAHT